MAIHQHHATIRWQLDGADFAKGRYPREHTWTFDGDAMVRASASPHVVPSADPSCVDPEEALVASAASCHMLTFLFLAARRGFVVTSYEDQAIGTMAKNERGVPWVATITLRPRIAYGGERRPTADEEQALHHDAHEGCYISHSIKSQVSIEPQAS